MLHKPQIQKSLLYKARGFQMEKFHQMRKCIILVHCEREQQQALFQNAEFTIAICCLMRSRAALSSAFSLFLSSNIRLVSSSSCRLLYSNISLPVFLLSISFLISFWIERYKNCLGQEKRLKHVCLRRHSTFIQIKKQPARIFTFLLPVLLLSFSPLFFLQAFLLT